MLRNQVSLGLHSETLIAGYEKDITIKDLYLRRSPVLAWSYDRENFSYQLKKVSSNRKTRQKMIKVTFEDNSYLICSPNYPLVKKDLMITLAKDSQNTYIRGFEKSNLDYINHYPEGKKVINLEYQKKIDECYELDGTTNCAIINSHSNQNTRGIILNI